MSRRLSAPPDYAALLDKYDTWMFDCDGVLWQGDKLIDGAVEVLRLLRERSPLIDTQILPLILVFALYREASLIRH